MSDLLDRIAGGLDTGDLRFMLPACRVGQKINTARERMMLREGEDQDAFLQRVRRKVHVLASKSGCLSYSSCAGCPRAHDAWARAAAEEYHCMDDHALAAVQQLGKEGPTRALPAACSIGRTVSALDAGGADSGEHGDAAIAALQGRFGCASQTSCLHCPLGRGVLDDVLRDLSESGLDGEAGRTLLADYGRLR